MKVKVVSPFSMGSGRYAPGDVVDVDKEKAESLKSQGLIDDYKSDGETAIPKKGRNKQQRTSR